MTWDFVDDRFATIADTDEQREDRLRTTPEDSELAYKRDSVMVGVITRANGSSPVSDLPLF
jgi:hypothetical protein